MRSHTLLLWLALLPVLLMSGCNRDEVIPAAALPEIVLSADDATYTTVTDSEIIIAPLFRNLNGGTVEWLLEGEVYATGPELRFISSSTGSFYFTVEATNSAGTSSADIRINVIDRLLPFISMRVPQGGFNVQTGTPITFTPELYNSSDPDYQIAWSVDGTEVSTERTFTFTPAVDGIYNIVVEASNSQGSASLAFAITATPQGPRNLYFPGLSYRYPSTTRYTFPGRPVCLWVTAEGFNPESYAWSINGEDASDATGPMLTFTPDRPGDYSVSVTTPEGATATATVVCVDSDEASRIRLGSGTSPALTVYEYTPAPGQFINEGTQADIVDAAAAASWASERLAAVQTVSLGAFGGCLVAGFDRSISVNTGGEYDFAIAGNQFDNAQGASCEPGVVWVMQDVNGNGLPDDQWYELRGSEWKSTDGPASFAVTYYQPVAPQLPVLWSDSRGQDGQVEYLPSHTQDSYYPLWLPASTYTLRGRLLPTRHEKDPVTGFWSNLPYGWGYVDNTGSDQLPGSSATGFKISNAVLPDGSPIELTYIDFIMIQSAVLGQSGHLGEISTEVTSITLPLSK